MSMVVQTLQLDQTREGEHQRHNFQQTMTLVGVMAAFLGLCAFLFLGWPGLAMAALAGATLWYLSPRVAPEMVMQLFRAVPVDPRGAPQLYAIRDQLAAKAGLSVPPDLYVVPSLALNAFSVGRPDQSAIAMTEGLLRKLDLREVRAVLAHELAHVKNDDLTTLGFADVLTRVLQVLSWVAIALAFMHLPSLLQGDFRVPWFGIALLYLGPTLGSLLQLALSRVREYDADLDAVSYTEDPQALASALAKIEQQTGQALDDLLPPGTRRMAVPSLLRSHPHTADRIKRLNQLTLAPKPWDAGPQGTMVTLAGRGPGSMRPRFRLPGVWF